MTKIEIVCQLVLGLGQRHGLQQRTQSKHMFLGSVWSLLYADRAQINKDITEHIIVFLPNATPGEMTAAVQDTKQHQQESI